jgi:hypothetical protein
VTSFSSRLTLAITLALALLVPAASTPATASVVMSASAGTDGGQRAAGDGPRKPKVTARQYWAWNDTCRGESDPAVHGPACRKRDRALRALGLYRAKMFHRAWKNGNRAAMRRMSSDDWFLAMTRGRATGRPDCSDDQRGGLYCWMRTKRGHWVGIRLEVTRHQYPRLPLWQVTGAAPDA